MGGSVGRWVGGSVGRWVGGWVDARVKRLPATILTRNQSICVLRPTSDYKHTVETHLKCAIYVLQFAIYLSN